jgi:hypothetical protein
VVGLAADTAAAIFGASQRGIGVHGVNDAPGGGAVKPQFGCGVWGESTNGLGVFGSSDNANGVRGVSKNGVGVLGAGPVAGQFDGPVIVNGSLTMNNGGDIVLADCAEEFACTPNSDFEPGSVMVLDEFGTIRPCASNYERGAVGIVSGAGAYRPAIVLDRKLNAEARAPIALVGKVYCKVDATFGAIQIGDLLTTSSTVGHAMKAKSLPAAFGAVVGKALQPLQSGRGLIPVLVTLQ